MAKKTNVDARLTNAARYPLGSPQSRAAVRAALNERRPIAKVVFIGRPAEHEITTVGHGGTETLKIQTGGRELWIK